MDNFNLLNDFAEGNLAPEQEHQLFAELANNQDLRSQLKGLMAVNSSLKSNAALFAPNPASKAAVFASIGLPLPNAVPNPIVNPAPAQNPTNLGMSKAKAYGISAIASLSSAIIVYILMLSFGTNINTENSELASNKAAMQSNIFEQNHNEIPKVIQSEAENATKSKEQIKVVYVPVEKIVYKEVEKDENSSSMVQDVALDNNKPLELMQTKDEENVESLNLNKQKTNEVLDKSQSKIQDIPNAMSENSPSNILNQIQIIPYDGSNLGFNVEWRGNENWSLQSGNANPDQAKKFNNNAIALFYEVNENIEIGAEIRQETFFQKFSGVNTFGQNSTFLQEPTYLTSSAAFRIKTDTYYGISPMAQLTVGANANGAVARFMSGLVYSPHKHFAFILGLEYSNMWYKHQNSTFNADKIGLNYGIQYKF